MTLVTGNIWLANHPLDCPQPHVSTASPGLRVLCCLREHQTSAFRVAGSALPQGWRGFVCLVYFCLLLFFFSWFCFCFESAYILLEKEIKRYVWDACA